jgi:uroporphyrinogen-III synthase
MPADTPTDRPLSGRTIVTTRERPGRLDTVLAALGADVVHVPLIETTDPADGGRALRTALAGIDRFEWVIVTSPVGAARVLPAVRGAACRVGVVGRRTAEVAAQALGRGVDVVPVRQTAADLVAALPEPGPARRLLLAQADRADRATSELLAERGFDVTPVVAYRTVLRTPSAVERRAALGADVVAFASGSAVTAWRDAIGTDTPPLVVSIGPATTAVALDCGVKVNITATDHSIEGLAAAIVRSIGGGP